MFHKSRTLFTGEGPRTEYLLALGQLATALPGHLQAQLSSPACAFHGQFPTRNDEGRLCPDTLKSMCQVSDIHT